MSIKFTEELKEALLKSRGRETLLVIRKDEEGNWVPMPYAYKVQAVSDKKLTLEPIEPEAPSEEKKNLVKSIVATLRERLKGDIEEAVEKALLEKTPEQLAVIAAQAPQGKLERNEGASG